MHEPHEVPRSAPRPGAMTRAMRAVHPQAQGPRALHIAVIRDGTIVEERIVARGQAVTAGRAEDNDIVGRDTGAPDRVELLRPPGDGYERGSIDGMRGRIQWPGTILDPVVTTAPGQP